MKIWNGRAELPPDRRPVVASIGNYDGVHRGHQAILAAAVEDAQHRGANSMLITFDPHPLTVVAPDRRPEMVQTRGQKLRSLERTGIDEVLIPIEALRPVRSDGAVNRRNVGVLLILDALAKKCLPQ